MNTRRLTKKYKYKNRNKKTRRNNRSGKTRRRGRSGRRILKGGVRQSVIPNDSRGSVRPRPSTGSFRPIIGTPFKPPQKTIFDKKTEIEEQKFIKYFFSGLEHNRFDSALCALHTFYTCSIDISDINKVISSEEFKTMYASKLFKEVTKYSHTNIEPQERLMLFLSYIFKKISEGATIRCSNGVVLHFTPGTGSFLKILKKFLGYLDTACVLTISYSIDKTTFDVIRGSTYAITGKLCHKPLGVTNGQLALYDLVTSLELLAEKYPEMKSDITRLLGLMTTGSGKNMVYSFNTTNICTLIKMTQQLFTYFDEPEP
jgi:hypothetical protein